MNKIYGTDGNVYETSISNGKENTSLKNEKEEFTIAELDKIKAEIEEHNRKYLSDDNAGLERAIWDFIEPHISKLKGENNND